MDLSIAKSNILFGVLMSSVYKDFLNLLKISMVLLKEKFNRMLAILLVMERMGARYLLCIIILAYLRVALNNVKMILFGISLKKESME